MYFATCFSNEDIQGSYLLKDATSQMKVPVERGHLSHTANYQERRHIKATCQTKPLRCPRWHQPPNAVLWKGCHHQRSPPIDLAAHSYQSLRSCGDVRKFIIETIENTSEARPAFWCLNEHACRFDLTADVFAVRG